MSDTLTWAGFTPEEHGEAAARRALENTAKIPPKSRRKLQRYRLRVLDDDVDREELYIFEGNRFLDPKAAVELVRTTYPGQYEAGYYDVEAIYFVGPFEDLERAVPMGGPLNPSETLWAVAYLRDYTDKSGYPAAELVAVTDYVDRTSAETKLAKIQEEDPDFDNYHLIADRSEEAADYYGD